MSLWNIRYHWQPSNGRGSFFTCQVSITSIRRVNDERLGPPCAHLDLTHVLASIDCNCVFICSAWLYLSVNGRGAEQLSMAGTGWRWTALMMKHLCKHCCNLLLLDSTTCGIWLFFYAISKLLQISTTLPVSYKQMTAPLYSRPIRVSLTATNINKQDAAG